MALRVVQWTTGNVGKCSMRAVVAHPDLELVGCYVWSAEKAGRDVGELGGIDAVGITATSDIDALLALRPDCIVYNPMWQNVEELVRILESGANVVSTAAFINGQNLGADRDRIAAACERGRSSMQKGHDTAMTSGLVSRACSVLRTFTRLSGSSSIHMTASVKSGCETHTFEIGRAHV